ncbi:MAG: YdcF family protein [Desulfobacteraceae bacterium]
MGEFLIHDDLPTKSEAAVILNTGVEYYPRLVEAASIYKKGLVKKIVINGNRKTDSLRELEAMGFKSCCPWYEDRMRILEMLGVPVYDVIPVSAEDAYDTVSEAEAVGREIVEKGYKKIILITSKYHTRRAVHIWKEMYKNNLDVASVSAKTDPFDPSSWWRDGRQVRWVLAEYGAWIFYYWQKITDI